QLQFDESWPVFIDAQVHLIQSEASAAGEIADLARRNQVILQSGVGAVEQVPEARLHGERLNLGFSRLEDERMVQVVIDKRGTWNGLLVIQLHPGVVGLSGGVSHSQVVGAGAQPDGSSANLVVESDIALETREIPEIRQLVGCENGSLRAVVGG